MEIPNDSRRRISWDSVEVLVSIPDEMATDGHVLIYTKEHRKTIADQNLSPTELQELGRGMNYFANILLKIKFPGGGAPERIYVFSECEEQEHLHFHLKARFSEHPKGDSFFIVTELDESRWGEDENQGRKRLADLQHLLGRHYKLLYSSKWKKTIPELQGKQDWLKKELEKERGA